MVPRPILLQRVHVDVACSCEVILFGEGAPPRFTQVFDEPVTNHRLDFINLTPNMNMSYACVVVASAPNYDDNEKTTNATTAPPFPVVTKFEATNVSSTFAAARLLTGRGV